MARLLDELPPLDDEAGAWYRPTVLGQLQDIHLRVIATLVDLATGADVDLGAAWFARFGDVLTADESTMLRRVVDRPRRLGALATWLDRASRRDAEASSPARPTDPLLKLGDAYRQAIIELVERVQEAADNPGEDADELERGAVNEP